MDVQELLRRKNGPRAERDRLALLNQLRIEQGQRMPHQDAIDRMIDLGEIGRTEVDLDAEFG